MERPELRFLEEKTRWAVQLELGLAAPAPDTDPGERQDPRARDHTLGSLLCSLTPKD